ncbi:hypothetical protein LZL87_013154 [Fusarium oxysporum]|nr:hypothetical protein LZL87_013154 [Fusarium oxysporum]
MLEIISPIAMSHIPESMPNMTQIILQVQSIQQDLNHHLQLVESFYQNFRDDIQRTESLISQFLQQLQPANPQRSTVSEAPPNSTFTEDKQNQQPEQHLEQEQQQKDEGFPCPHSKCLGHPTLHKRWDNLERHYTIRQFSHRPTWARID